MALFSHYSLVFLTLLHSLVPPILPFPASIPISFLNTIRHSDPLPRLKHIVSTSLARAHHLKDPQSAATTSLFPYGGAYTVSLSFGSPPQSIPMVLDTGSSFSWLPCTTRYVCRSCSASAIHSFIPKQSSSARFLGCINPKCGWVHRSFDSNSTCQDCNSNVANCTQICPPYIILYGSGSTGGLAMVETVNFPDKVVPNFLVGCSLFSSNQPAGVAAFGRGASSFPSQLGLKKFSYCLVSHKFDNTPKSSTLLMDSGSDSSRKTDQFNYTLLLDNPPGLSEYYYIGLRKITVGGQKVEVSYQELVPDSDGNGGTIVDSGTTFTYMNPVVSTAVANAFFMQVNKEYGRDSKVESLTGLRPCFDVTGGVLAMPELKLHFKGGVAMALPLENYFFSVDDVVVNRSVVCLGVVSDNSVLGPELTAGPAVILGNFFMQNYWVEYDLRNKRFGFRQQSCS